MSLLSHDFFTTAFSIWVYDLSTSIRISTQTECQVLRVSTPPSSYGSSIIFVICAVPPSDLASWSLLPSWLFAYVPQLFTVYSQKVRWRNSSQYLGSHIRHCFIVPRNRNRNSFLSLVLFRTVLGTVNVQTVKVYNSLLCAIDISSHLFHAECWRLLDVGHQPPKSKHRPPGHYCNQPDMSTNVKSSVQLDS